MCKEYGLISSSSWTNCRDQDLYFQSILICTILWIWDNLKPHMRLNISKVQLKDVFTQAQKPWQLEVARENCVFPNQLLTSEIGHKKGCCSGNLSANALISSRLLQLPVFCMKYIDLSGNSYYTLSCSEIWKCLKLETDDNHLQSCILLLQKKVLQEAQLLL